MGGSSASTVAAGTCDVPAEAGPEPTTGATVVGDGTPASCTAAAFETAVQKGGPVTFNCGPDQATITLDHQIELLNNAGPGALGHRVIDGGSKVTLSGGDITRLFYQDACDPSLGQVAGDCTNSPNPSLVIQNLALANAYGPSAYSSSSDGLGGGAIYLRGGSLKVFFSSFCNNVTDQSGYQYAGGASTQNTRMGGSTSSTASSVEALAAPTDRPVAAPWAEAQHPLRFSTAS